MAESSDLTTRLTTTGNTSVTNETGREEELERTMMTNTSSADYQEMKERKNNEELVKKEKEKEKDWYMVTWFTYSHKTEGNLTFRRGEYINSHGSHSLLQKRSTTIIVSQHLKDVLHTASDLRVWG